MTAKLVHQHNRHRGSHYIVTSDRRGSLHPEDTARYVERAWAMHKQNMTANEIAMQLDVSTRTVDRYLSRKRKELAANAA